jgi:hypothetical protein
MRHLLKLSAAAVAALVVVSTSVSAQSRGTRSSARAAGQPRLMELGLDGGLAFGLSDPKVTTFGLPVQSLRAGFYMSDALSIEPIVSMNYQNVSANGGSVSANNLDLGVGAVWHLNPNRAERQFYVRPFVDMLHVGSKFKDTNGGVTTTESTSDNAMGLGAGLGVKIPVMSRMVWRLETQLAHRLESGAIGSQTSLGFSAGFSFFTR